MPRIDPLKLLTCLKVLLAPNGGIRSANEVKRLAELMAKYSKKLVSKCIYIQILKCTDTELLGKFMGVGGWLLTHMWLSEGIRAMNWPLVQEILELLLLCPVDVQRLRSNTAPKLVKGLSKEGGNEGVRILAAKLVEQWLKVVKGETMASSESVQVADNQTKSENFTNQSNAGNQTSAKSQPEESAQEDPLAVPSSSGDSSAIMSPSRMKNSDAALVYKIVVKDGIQMLAKVVNGVPEASETDSKADKSEKSDSVAANDVKNDISSDKQSNKENEAKGKESEEKESRTKDSEREKSRSSKDKDKNRDHKSSSSSHHKSSSSKSSSSKSSSSSSSSKTKSSSHRRSDSSSRKDKEHSSDRDKHKSSSSSSKSSSHSSRDSKDRSKQKERDRAERSKNSEKEPEKSQSEKDKETLSKIVPTSIDKLGKIPKKPREDSIEEPLVTSITIPSKKASMSIEIRKDNNRPKTVKTFNSQFRSHGLSEEAPPPPSRKGLKKPPVQSIPGTSIPSSALLTKRLSPPPQPASSSSPLAAKESLPPAEKKLKIDLTTAPGIEKPGAVKFIAPKPKPSLLIESDMFMDALSASAPIKKDVRKRKRRPSNSKDSGKDGSSPPESPVSSSKVAPLKFYQDTLEEDERSESMDDSRDENSDEKKNDDEDDIPLKRVKEQIEERVREEKQQEERLIRENEDPEDNVKKPPGPGCGPDGPPGVLMLHRRKGPKKQLKWRTQEHLEEIRYFELDENERVNVTKTFTDMKQIERFNERDAFVLARKLNCEDVMAEQTPWVALVLVDDVPLHPEGSQSKEKKIQNDRELSTLKALYFNRHMIPNSPSEPDMEQYQITEPATIPIDDITGNPDAVNDFTSMPWPDPKGSPPPGDDFMGGSDMPFPNGQFNPFMPFGGNGGWMGPGPNTGLPNGVMPPPGIGGPMGGPFNNMMGGPPHGMMMGGPPQNMMMGGPPDDMGMNCNMNMMPSNFGPPGPNFGGPPNNGMGNFNNFGPPMNMNAPGMNMNMNNGPPRGGGGGGGGGRGGGGNWRSGSAGPPGGGGNWRPQGGPPNGAPGRNWMSGTSNSRICKQFQRGFCRNGNKCNFLHPPSNNNQRF